MSGYLLDTNVVSEPTKAQPDPNVRDWFTSIPETQMFISVLTLGELKRGIAGLPASARRARLEGWFATLLERFGGRILPIDQAVADRWGVMVALAESAGKTLPGVDSLLAATALQHNLTLVTRDTSELAITGVQLFNPWEA